jgi:hypothetical protein
MSEPGPTPPLGIMLYGYSEKDAAIVRERISQGAGCPIDILSAWGNEDSTVSSILDSGGSGRFSDGERKILMFLGFNDEALGKAMDDLRGVPGVRRPIFCCLTEENINWKLSDLIKDLEEEDRYFKSRKDPPRNDPSI